MAHVAQASLSAPSVQSLGSCHRVLKWQLTELSLAMAFTNFLAEAGVAEAPSVCADFVDRVYVQLHYTEEEMNQVVFACYLVHQLYLKQQALRSCT